MILKLAMWRNSKKPYSKCLMSSCLSSSTFLVVLILLVPLFMVLIVFSCISWSWRFGSVSSTSFSSSQPELFSSTSQNTPYKYFEAQAAEAPLLFPNVSIPNETAQPPQLGGGKQEKLVKRRERKLKKLETKLAKVRTSIREAAKSVGNLTFVHEDPDYVPQGPIYRNVNAFHRSYLEMEKHLKIYVYEEGEPPILHNGPCKSIYSTVGRFIQQMEKDNKYRTRDPNEALVFFLPFSVVMMVQYLYVPDSHDITPIGRAVTESPTMSMSSLPSILFGTEALVPTISCFLAMIGGRTHPHTFHKSSMQCRHLRRLQPF